MHQAETTRAADGRTLCFAQWGDLDGRPVFGLHGTPGCRLLRPREVELGFEELLRSLGVRLVTYDRPGYGGSDRQSGRRIVDSVSDVEALAQAVGVESFSVLGGSSGSMYALAVADGLHDRVTKVGCVAPMAPYDKLGYDEWSKGQADAVREYVHACLDGAERMISVFSSEDSELRAAALPDDPAQAEVFEQTRNGLWGWVDDELAAFQSWGFDPSRITVPTQLWFDPDDPVLPPQHAQWLARTIPGAETFMTKALGHGSSENPRPDWMRLYSWLTA